MDETNALIFIFAVFAGEEDWGLLSTQRCKQSIDDASKAVGKSVSREISIVLRRCWFMASGLRKIFPRSFGR